MSKAITDIINEARRKKDLTIKSWVSDVQEIMLNDSPIDEFIERDMFVIVQYHEDVTSTEYYYYSKKWKARFGEPNIDNAILCFHCNNGKSELSLCWSIELIRHIVSGAKHDKIHFVGI